MEDDLRQLLIELRNELNAANSREQLEGYFNYLAEDADLGRRLTEAGVEPIELCPDRD